jgi:O-antigen biosynthesis protein WbqP
MIRVFDVFFSLFGLLTLSPLLFALYLIGLFDSRAPLFFQSRVGQWQRPFTLVKFRTMRLDTASTATHLADASSVTPWGRFLRRSKLDELPQLWNVLLGDMSLVGPRPCLFNQVELIAERSARNVFHARPGITGLAQVKGVDMSSPALLAEIDSNMIATLSALGYFKYIFLTLVGRGAGDRALERR